MAPGHAASAARERTKEDFAEEMRTSDEFLEFAAAWWPVLDAATVLGWLRDPDLLARVSEGVLDDESVRLLAKSWGPRTQLSVDDVALLDELRYLLGDPPIVNTGSVDDEYLGARGLPRCRRSSPPPTASTPARAAGRRRPTGSRTTASRTCSSTRPRT